MIWLLTSAALAAEPSFGGHLYAASGQAPELGPHSLGVGLSAGAWFSPRFAAEVLAQGGLGGVAIRPELRFVLSAPEAASGRLEAVLGYGVQIAPDLGPLGVVGLGWAAPTRRERWTLRVDGRYVVAGMEPEAFQLSVGLVRQPPPSVVDPEPIEVAPPEPDPIPEPEPEPEPLGGPEWVPYPVCEWLPSEQAAKARADAASEAQPGPTPGSADVVVLDPTSPSQGSVIVVSRPGDQVEVQGETLTIGPTGLVVIAAPPGRLDLSITGAGQATDFVVGVGADQVVWVRGDTLPAPEPLRIHYPGGSREISAEELQLLEEFIVMLGDWDVQVQGFYSPEGSRAANLELAESRALAAKQVLIDNGISEDRITILPPPESAPTELSTTDQRAALVLPVIPGAAP